MKQSAELLVEVGSRTLAQQPKGRSMAAKRLVSKAKELGPRLLAYTKQQLKRKA